jgi:hypothetical protein
MLRRILAWIAAILMAGVVLGAGNSAWAALQFGGASFLLGTIRPLDASAAPRAQPAAGPYTRAIIAREGLLALSAREAVYFTMYEDDARPAAKRKLRL